MGIISGDEGEKEEAFRVYLYLKDDSPVRVDVSFFVQNKRTGKEDLMRSNPRSC